MTATIAYPPSNLCGASMMASPFRPMHDNINVSNTARITPNRKRSRQDDASAHAPRKIQMIMSSLPQRLSVQDAKVSHARDSGEGASTATKSPHELVVSSIEALTGDATVRSSLDVQNFFVEHTDEQVESYGHDVVQAIRSKDIDALRQMHESGRPLQCSNRFGESLIHMACRRGFVDVARFLIKEAGVSIRVRDDYGRTPLHDACWTCEPKEELMELLISSCPELLLLKDKRGNAPFEYVRREHWSTWTKFVERRKDILCPKN